jgi:hypothetical protein
LGLRGLDAHISACEQIHYCSGLFHCDLLNSLDITDPVAEGIDDLDVLNVRDSIPSIAEMFHVILEAFMMLLLASL